MIFFHKIILTLLYCYICLTIIKIMKNLKSIQISNYVLKGVIVCCFLSLNSNVFAQTYTHAQGLTYTSGTFTLDTPTHHFDNLSLGITGGFYLGSNTATGLPGSMGWQTIQDQAGGWFFRNTNRAMLWEYGHWNQMWTLKMSNNNPTALGSITWKNLMTIQGDGVDEMKFCGTIWGRKVKVDAGGWCDYVFQPNYTLMPLWEVNAFIKFNKHLPGVPSEKEILRDGIDVGEMQKIHMKKIEELTLYAIGQSEEVAQLNTKVLSLEARILQLETLVAQIIKK